MHRLLSQTRHTAGLFFVLMVLVAAMTVSVPVSAQSEITVAQNRPSVLDRIRAKMREKKTGEDKLEEWFEKLDLDKSGDVTKNELFESVRRRFDRMDANRDRLISLNEYLGSRGNRSAGRSRFGRLDSNKDGFLTRQEFVSPADWRFDRIDRNLDGKVSRTEAARLFDRQKGEDKPDEIGECFYVDRQVIRVKGETLRTFKKRGYPKTDCNWTPDQTDLDKAEENLKKNK